MGEQLRREFSFDPIPVGPPAPWKTQQQQPMSEAIPGMGGTPAMPPTIGMQAGSVPFSDPRIMPDQPQRVRMTFLQSFLSNLGPALMGGLTPTGHLGETAGIGGALQAIQQQQQLRFMNQMRQMEAAKEQAESQSRQALQAAELNRINVLLPGQVQEQQQNLSAGELNLQQRRALINLADNPTQLEQLYNSIIGSLGTFNGDETALLSGAKAQVRAKLLKGELDVSPLNQAIAKIAEMRASAAGPERAAYNSYLQKGGTPEAWPAYKAATEAQATQPYKLQLAAAEGKARQLIEGISKPVYVFTKEGGARQLMSQTDAIKAGYRTMLPVTEKQVGEDIQLNNRLADVENKIGRYQQTFAQDLSFADKNAIAQVIGEDKFKAGLWGSTLPVDFLNKANEAYLHGKLSKQAADRLIGYYNANESLIGYNRVLSGSARSNEKQLELQSRTLPSPIDNPSFGNNALTQFKENLDYAGQGLPQLPGIKTHQQVRTALEGETAQRGQSAGGLQVGQQVKLKNGKTVTVTAVHLDGTFDAK